MEREGHHVGGLGKLALRCVSMFLLVHGFLLRARKGLVGFDGFKGLLQRLRLSILLKGQVYFEKREVELAIFLPHLRFSYSHSALNTSPPQLWP